MSREVECGSPDAGISLPHGAGAGVGRIPVQAGGPARVEQKASSRVNSSRSPRYSVHAAQVFGRKYVTTESFLPILCRRRGGRR